MKVTLKADLGDHKKGDVLDIQDKTVIAAWITAKVIDKPKGFTMEEAEVEGETETEAEVITKEGK